ncbi:MAG: leucine-rich repeat domain-containing protein [Candidatus Thorarchaeota archaeon]
MTRVSISCRSSGKVNSYSFSSSSFRLWLRNEEIEEIDLKQALDFPNLKEIYLDNNMLRAIDLTPLASCQKLEVLSFANNILESINLFPLTRCSNLRWLSLSNNRLTSLNLTPLSRCSRLENLYLSGNEYNTLDLKPLRRCTELREITVSQDDDGGFLTRDAAINISHLALLKKLSKLTISKSHPVTMSLLSNRFQRIPDTVAQYLNQETYISIEDIVSNRIERSGRKNAIASLEEEIENLDPQYWLPLRKDFLKPLGLEVLAGHDGDLSLLFDDSSHPKNWRDEVIHRAANAIENGSLSTLYNLDEFDDANANLVKLKAAILESRSNEIKYPKVYVCERCADLREIWYTAWGLKILTELRHWIFATSGPDLIELRDMLRQIGFDLRFTPVKLREPWPKAANEPSHLVKRAILGSAERTTSNEMKTKATKCILSSEIHPLRGELENIILDIYG